MHGDYRHGNIIFDNDKPEVAAVLDWELATIGHPLADLGYFMMPYYIDAEASGYGTQGDGLLQTYRHSARSRRLLETYAKSAGRSHVPAIDYYVIFSMFRLAAIQVGVLRRGLDGNAADPRAVERGRPYTSRMAAERVGS